MTLKYKNIRLSCYNEFPQEENSFHVDVRLAEDKPWKEKEILAKLIKPALHCLYSKMIPEMPDPSLDSVIMAKFPEWFDKYYGS